MKKLIRVVISCVLILSCFAGCGKEQSTTPTGYERISRALWFSRWSTPL